MVLPADPFAMLSTIVRACPSGSSRWTWCSEPGGSSGGVPPWSSESSECFESVAEVCLLAVSRELPPPTASVELGSSLPLILAFVGAGPEDIRRKGLVWAFVGAGAEDIRRKGLILTFVGAGAEDIRRKGLVLTFVVVGAGPEDGRREGLVLRPVAWPSMLAMTTKTITEGAIAG